MGIGQKKKKRTKTKEEKAYLEAVAQINCMACGAYPVEVHHLTGAGMGLKASHFDTMPLCYDCHRGTFSIHNCKRSFEAKYGFQKEMIEKTKRIINNG